MIGLAMRRESWRTHLALSRQPTSDFFGLSKLATGGLGRRLFIWRPRENVAHRAQGAKERVTGNRGRGQENQNIKLSVWTTAKNSTVLGVSEHAESIG